MSSEDSTPLKLLRKAYTTFNIFTRSRLDKKFLLYFCFLIFLPKLALSYLNQGSLASLLTAIVSEYLELVFFILIIIGLKANGYIPDPSFKTLINKSFRVFNVLLVSRIFILLGFILFIVPGVILYKRYLYVGIIAEGEKIGPLHAMERSSSLSKHNGWFVTIALIVNSLFIGLIYSLYSLSPSLINTLFLLASLWANCVVSNLVVFNGFQNAISK